MKTRGSLRWEMIALVAAVALLASLALKSLKQFVYLSFTLLSLKIVWGLLLVLVLLNVVRRRAKP